jgi:hypothetical protein
MKVGQIKYESPQNFKFEDLESLTRIQLLVHWPGIRKVDMRFLNEKRKTGIKSQQ